MNKMLRFLLAFVIFLSLGIGQVASIFLFPEHQEYSYNEEGVQLDEPILPLSDQTIWLVPDSSIERGSLNLTSETVEEETEDKNSHFFLLIQVALSSLFFFLLIGSFRAYLTKFLLFNKNFSFTLPCRIHLSNSVLTI